jgi:DNA-binding PadR family transcriptional regulator
MAKEDALYEEAVAEFGPALERLARAYESDPDKRHDLLQEIHVTLWLRSSCSASFSWLPHLTSEPRASSNARSMSWTRKNADGRHNNLTSAADFYYAVGQMSQTDSLGQFEQLVLSAIVALGDKAYGVTIQEKVEQLGDGTPVSPGAVYVTLDRLEDKGLVKSWMADPTPERGGRRKRYYQLQAAGERALTEALRTALRMTDAVQESWGGIQMPGRKRWKPIRQG